MSYKTIAVHVDQSRHAAQRMQVAVRLATEHEAHLIGVAALGVSREVFPGGYHALPGTLEASYFDPLRAIAAHALDEFGKLAAEAGVASEQRLVCDVASEALAHMARFADLAIVSQDDPDEALGRTAVRIPEYVAFTCARPVLALPCVPLAHGPGRHVLVAWNGSKEASAALLAAVPLMQRAVRVTVASFGPRADADPEDARQPADLCAFLARHDVPAVFSASDSDIDEGRALLGMAQREGYDLLVMGCYGHSQFRELFLGGVTRTVLHGATIPVLMAH